jgi:hypothetical protein
LNGGAKVSKVDTAELKCKTVKNVTGKEWGWLSPEGVLYTVPKRGGQHEQVANAVCKLLGLSGSVTMEKMGWIRVDGPDVRCGFDCEHLDPETGRSVCISKEQKEFLDKAFHKLSESAVSSDPNSNAGAQKKAFRTLLVQANVREGSTCSGSKGSVVTVREWRLA